MSPAALCLWPGRKIHTPAWDRHSGSGHNGPRPKPCPKSVVAAAAARRSVAALFGDSRRSGKAQLHLAHPDVHVLRKLRLRNQTAGHSTAARRASAMRSACSPVQPLPRRIENPRRRVCHVKGKVGVESRQKDAGAARHVRVVGQIHPARRVFLIRTPPPEDRQKRLQVQRGRRVGQNLDVYSLKIHLGKSSDREAPPLGRCASHAAVAAIGLFDEQCSFLDALVRLLSDQILAALPRRRGRNIR